MINLIAVDLAERARLSGDLRLVDFKHSRDFSLVEPLSLDNLVEWGQQPGLGVEFCRIRQSHVSKDIAAAANDSF